MWLTVSPKKRFFRYPFDGCSLVTAAHVIRTAGWAKQPAQSVSESAEVRTGKREDSDDWEVQSVLIKKHVGEDTSREQATKIIEKIDSRVRIASSHWRGVPTS